MGERYSGGGMDLASVQTLAGRQGVRKVFWNAASPDAARFDQFERRLEVFLRNPIIEGDVVASSFSTAETGRRVEIRADSAARVRFYSGKAAETDNGVLNIQDFAGREIANWVPPELGNPGPLAGTYRSQIVLYARDNVNTSLAQIFADDINYSAVNAHGFFGAPLRGINGSLSAPTYSFLNGTNTGMYSNAGNDIRFGVLGVLGALVHVDGLRVIDGSLSNPSLSFFNDTDTGFYRAASNRIDWVGGGSFGGFLHSGGVRTVDGGPSIPTYSFSNDPDTGMYRFGTNILGLTGGNNTGYVIIESTSDAPLRIFDSATTVNPSSYVMMGGSDYAVDALVGLVAGTLQIRNYTSNAILFYTDNAARWQINATTGDLRPNTAGSADLGTSTFEVGQIFALLSSGTGDNLEHNASNEIVFDTSTRRHKFNRRPWRLEKWTWVEAINQLQPTEWNRAVTTFVNREDRTKDPRTRIEHRPGNGLIAENVHEVLGPLAATYEEDGVTVRNFRDRSVIAALVGAVQELSAEIAELKRQRR